jgi:hypothetical protein
VGLSIAEIGMPYPFAQFAKGRTAEEQNRRCAVYISNQ